MQNSDTGWHLIATLPDRVADATHVVLWNPCDGLHLFLTTTSLAEIDEMRRGKIFTHWRRLDEPTPINPSSE